MIPISFPTSLGVFVYGVIALAILFWTVTPFLFVAAAVATVRIRGWGRIVPASLTLLLIFPLWISEQEGLRWLHSRPLSRAEVIEGLTLPAGTKIVWSEVPPLHLQPQHLSSATLPVPHAVLGVLATSIEREDDGVWLEVPAWKVKMPAAQTIDGWVCGKEWGGTEAVVRLSLQGHLLLCTLAQDGNWKGWQLPAGTEVTFATDGGVSKINLPFDPPRGIQAPEIDGALTDGATLNPDGSLASAYFDIETPLIVRGTPLGGTITFTYAPETFGQGRNRRPISISGEALPKPNDRNGGNCEGAGIGIRMADGQITPTGDQPEVISPGEYGCP